MSKSKSAVLNSLTSSSGQRTYDHAIREFVAWYCSEPASRSAGRGETACRPRCSRMSFARRRLEPASTSWRRTIFGAPVLVCATSPAEHWTRSSSCWAMFQFKRRSVISDVSRDSAPP